jgi:hypothetical protein
MTLPLKVIMALCLLASGVMILAPEAWAQCTGIQDGSQCLPPSVLYPNTNHPATQHSQPRIGSPPSSGPRPAWMYAPPLEFSDDGPHVTALFFSPDGYLTRVIRNDESRALQDGQIDCSYHDPLRRKCTLVDIIINGSVSHAYAANGKVVFGFDRNAQNSARRAMEECNLLYPAQGCKLLTTPVGSIQGEDPQVRAQDDEFRPLPPAAAAAMARSLAERDARGDPPRRLGS